jgi:large subunit ribosomal protein L17
MITLGRRGDIHARRQAVAFLRSKDIVHKLFTEVAPRFAQRPGGYSRIVKLGPRYGDAAEMVYLELVDTPLVFKTRLPRDETEVEVAEAEAEVDEVEEGAPEVEAEADTADPEASEASDDAEGSIEESADEADQSDEPRVEDEPAK